MGRIEVVEQGPVDRTAVVDRRRVRILGGQSVVDAQHPASDGVGEMPGELPVAVERPEDVSTAMDILEHTIVAAALGNRPPAGTAGNFHVLPCDRIGLSGHLAECVAAGPHLLDRGRLGAPDNLLLKLYQQPLDHLCLRACHGCPL